MNSFKELKIEKLEDINGGFSKQDIKGIAGSAAFVGGAMLLPINAPVAIGLIGGSLTTWDTMN